MQAGKNNKLELTQNILFDVRIVWFVGLARLLALPRLRHDDDVWWCILCGHEFLSREMSNE
jgi:hypothetical protein